MFSLIKHARESPCVPVEAKSLFRPDVLPPRPANFRLPGGAKVVRDAIERRLRPDAPEVQLMWGNRPAADADTGSGVEPGLILSS
jgi:hypothetical protein